MCLVKVHEEPELVPYRRVARTSRYYSPPRSARVSRTIVEERRPPSVVSHHVEKTRVTSVSSPPAKQVPPPQPVPVFVKPEVPPPPPPPPPAAPRPPSPSPVHLVEVSPHSSHTSVSTSDYIVREHEIRRHRTTAEYSPSPARSSFTERSPRYETFRYIEPPDDRHWSRSSERSVSRDRRGHFDEPRESYRSTRIEVNTSRRPREYWR
ncbi:hypothetical protein UCRNP2_662 [Neofusicoccum parvum UCRNP2]|uniref:Uncharacterized protein n=1 Tax=Botryosphaeria parva (strain UCR-NP2) TaxID=1287680 RepID=R1EY70_BOTPV|nr:hypothetical protein UCRNP2_662 [Neofusicoccum parvum UCRNP2]